jgi:hypothetical protein
MRKLFWKAGGLLAAFVLTLAIANFFLPPDKAFDRHMFGHDFLPFYTAGELIRTGQAGHLYDPVLTRTLEHQTCQAAGLVIHNEYGAFLNPPFAALPAAWLARWPYPKALLIWTAFLVACLFTAILLMARMLPPQSTWRTWMLIPLLMLPALPVWQAALHAQNTFFSLLVLTTTVTLWRKQYPLAAGLVGGLLLFKPQLGVILAVVLVATQGRRAFAGLAITAAALLLITVTALPGSLGAYLHDLPINLRAIQELPNYTWQRHVTFLAWWRILLQGHTGALPQEPARWLSFICTAAVGAAFLLILLRTRKDAQRRDRLIAAAIATSPLLMPYYMDYDLTLLAVAAVLCACDALHHRIDRTVCFAWIAFYLIVEVNPPIAGSTRIIPAVPALIILSTVLLRKARQPMTAVDSPASRIDSFAMAA